MEIIFVIVLLVAFLYSNKDKFKINKPELVLEVAFTFPIDPKKMRELHEKLMETGDIKALQAVRLVEIILDSLYIARTTKNIETAKSRLDLALNNYIELQSEFPDIARQIEAQYLEWKNESINWMYINASDELVKKSKKVKMQKTKDKYIQNAIQILEDGLLNGADSGLLLQEIEKLKNNV